MGLTPPNIPKIKESKSEKKNQLKNAILKNLFYHLLWINLGSRAFFL